jgi:hypothetical protein
VHGGFGFAPLQPGEAVFRQVLFSLHDFLCEPPAGLFPSTRFEL